MSLSESGFERKTKRTRKSEFLGEMSLVVPCAELVSLNAPHAPAPGAKGGRPPFAVATMLRNHFLQQWFSLSDPAMKDALYDMALFCDFVGLDAGEDNLPNESTILRFRQSLEAHNLSLQILSTVNDTLAANGLLLKSGTVVDATLIAAPNSTKNSSGERDSEMHQTKKGNQWRFGMTAHIGVDADSGLVHTVVDTAANVNDVTHALVDGEEADVFADSGHQGVGKRDKTQGVEVNWHVAMRSGKHKVLDKSELMGAIMDQLERVKTRIRAKVEHAVRVIKRQFRHMKVRDRGLAKNTAQLLTLAAQSNLWIVRRMLLQEMRG